MPFWNKWKKSKKINGDHFLTCRLPPQVKRPILLLLVLFFYFFTHCSNIFFFSPQASDDHKRGQQIKDVSYLSTKYMFRVYGKDVPTQTRNENPVMVLVNLLQKKWGIILPSEHLGQIQACHRTRDGGLIVAVNTTIPGSIYHQVMARDGNWNGEKMGPAAVALNIEIRKEMSRYDKPIHDLLLWIRRREMEAGVPANSPTRRVRQTKPNRGGWVDRIDGTGKHHKVNDIQEVKKLLTAEEESAYQLFLTAKALSKPGKKNGPKKNAA